MTARFYFDLNSPYAYLAAQRVDDVVPGDVDWSPIAFGPLIVQIGKRPWSLGPEREAGIAEIERRAAERGLPPVRWPEGWPARSYSVDGSRAALVGRREGRGREVALAVFAQVFVEGRPLNDPALLDAVGDEVGLPGLRAAVEEPAIKEELQERTAAAIERGISGVPTVEVGGELYWGDDRLEDAAAAA